MLNRKPYNMYRFTIEVGKRFILKKDFTFAEYMLYLI
jgi:hypothetical protein